jgi:hypothetical protein
VPSASSNVTVPAWRAANRSTAASLAPRTSDTKTRAVRSGEVVVKDPSATPCRMIVASNGVMRAMTPRRNFSRTIALSSESQTRMSARMKSLRSALKLARPEKTASNFSSADRSGSATAGASEAVAPSTIRETTPSSRAAFESK